MSSFSLFNRDSSRIRGFRVPGKDEYGIYSQCRRRHPFNGGYQPLVLNSANDGRFYMQSSSGGAASYSSSALLQRLVDKHDKRPTAAAGRQLDIGQQATTLRPLHGTVDNHNGPSTPTSNSVNHDPGSRLSPMDLSHGWTLCHFS